MTALLFEPLRLRSVELRNRIAVSPMCQYSAREGALTDWHLVHLGARATGGAGLVMVEATAVEARGRISPQDSGLWDERHEEPLARIVRFLHEQGAASGIQLAHAGRKASTRRPWDGSGAIPESEGGWSVVGPTAEPFDAHYPAPRPLSEEELAGVRASFVRAAERAARVGFSVVEVHAAHGYLLSSFLSPVSNTRTDRYGGSLENRARLLLETVDEVRRVWPDEKPLFVRLSACDWVEGGITLDEVVQVARWLAARGVDVIDTSSGGVSPKQKITGGAGYQVPFAERIRRDAGVKTMAVGLITDPRQAEEILAKGQADLVAIARELLRDPNWPQRAAKALGAKPPVPPQYARAHP